MAHLFPPEVVAAVHPKIVAHAVAERRPVPLGPNLEIGDAHPTQEFPAREVHARQINMEDDQGKDEEGEGSAYEEGQEYEDLLLRLQALVLFGLPQDDPDAHRQTRE